MKKSISLLLAAAVSAALISGCSSSAAENTQSGSADSQTSAAADSAPSETPDGEAESGSASAESEQTAEGSYTIGIGQYAVHGSLDNCREGFLQGLAEETFTALVTRAEEQAARDQQAAKQAEQQAKVAEAQELLDQINADVAEVNRQLDEEDASWAAIGAEIDRKQKQLEEQRKQNNVQLPPAGNGWMWPLPSANRKLTSAFGFRMHPVDHVPHSHTGIDVAASTGTPIYAARGGQVIMSEYGTGVNWSYGNFVVIDHGDGTTTLYAHMSSRAVSEGELVQQGQTIGAVGTTGNVKGAHLHFEVRINGQRTDPEAYYTGLPLIRAYNW